MPAIMDDPASPTIYRVSGAQPFPDPKTPGFPSTIKPRQVTLRDRQTKATIIPFASASQVPPTLLKYLSDQFAKEIQGGDTYPMIEPMPHEKYCAYWFQNFAVIMLLGTIESPEDVVEGKDWSKECLGSFYIKPNYPGRSSHVCNAGFIVTDAARNRGVGRLMGEAYLDYAPKLGYTYSVFNLVYETNVASCKIWDALGFKRIGRVKDCGNLKSYPDRLVDAIIYGRDLGEAAGEGADGPVSEERFDKIKFYLKYGRYPNGSDRAEKSRLRSAATHYKLLENGVLMLKDKEVISDPIRQLDIAKQVHLASSHAGINKTTATIAERYHWSRIKETVSDVIRLCQECKDVTTPFPGSQRKPVADLSTPNKSPPSSASMTSVLMPEELEGSQSPSSEINLRSRQKKISKRNHKMSQSVGTPREDEISQQFNQSSEGLDFHIDGTTSGSSSMNGQNYDFQHHISEMTPNPNQSIDQRILSLQHHENMENLATSHAYANPSDIVTLLNSDHEISESNSPGLDPHDPMLQDRPHNRGNPMDSEHQHRHHHNESHQIPSDPSFSYSPIDPQIMRSSEYQTGHSPFSFRLLPHHPSQMGLTPLSSFSPMRSPAHEDAFQTFLNDAEVIDHATPEHQGHDHDHDHARQHKLNGDPAFGHGGSQPPHQRENEQDSDHDQAAMDREIEMLIEHPPDDDSDMEDVDADDSADGNTPRAVGEGGGDGDDLDMHSDAGGERDASGGTRRTKTRMSSTEGEEGMADVASRRRNDWDHVIFDVP